MQSRIAAIVAAVVGATFSFAASVVSAQQPAQPLKLETAETLTATVESIDVEKRLLEVKSGDKTRTVQVPVGVQNLSKLKRGDVISLEYREGIAAQFKKKGESTTVGIVDAHKDTVRAAPGAKPGGSVANVVTTTVVIESVDRPSNSVTFTGPSGMTRTVEVKDPSAQAFIGSLNKGDEVEVTFTEALAISVQPQKK